MARDDIDPTLDAWYRRRTVDIADDKARRDRANWLGLGDAARQNIRTGEVNGAARAIGPGEDASRFHAMAATPSSACTSSVSSRSGAWSW